MTEYEIRKQADFNPQTAASKKPRWRKERKEDSTIRYLFAATIIIKRIDYIEWETNGPESTP